MAQEVSCLVVRPKGRFGHDTRILTTCDSTNDVAMALVKEGCSSGTVVIAKEQTRGKGRLGRSWQSFDGNLALSLIIRPSLDFRESYKLVFASALAVVAALEKSGIKAFIKWPNDIVALSADGSPVEKLGPYRKLGGILLELSGTDQKVDAAVIGIGLNMLRPQDSQPLLPQMGFVSDQKQGLKLETFVDTLLNALEDHLMDPLAANLLEETAQKSAFLGKRVRVEESGPALLGIAEGLSNDGALLVRLDDGQVKGIHYGDVHLE
jgi:BirA family biotin operon repressor/biotin-[acetyl-CoA-carboxylase] ligase